MRTTAATNDPLFDRFWKAYPRKEGKPKAQKTFEKLKVTPEILQDIMAELNRRDWEENQNAETERTDTEHTADQYGAVIC